MQLNKITFEKQITKATEYLDEKKNIKAEKFLKKIIAKSPYNEEAMLLLGIANRRLGFLKKAIECFKKTTELNRSMEEAWGLLTITYIDQGNLNLAKKTIERARQMNPNNTTIQYLQKTLIQTYIKYGPFFDINQK
ncbi:MAG: tetratricopeptide repeat protein [Promethearchaeota archaeon]